MTLALSWKTLVLFTKLVLLLKVIGRTVRIYLTIGMSLLRVLNRLVC